MQALPLPLFFFLSALLFLSRHVTVSCHGALTAPASTRHGGSLDTAGDCERNQCMWFSQMTSIPPSMYPTLNASVYRTYNIHSSDCSAEDWSCRNPWRAPGFSPVLGSGCGVAGGSPVPLFNGGFAPPPYAQGADAAHVLSPMPPTVWPSGSVQEVAWALTANHGGGYSYRLCRADNPADVSEACFQSTPLSFASDVQYLQYPSRVPGSPRYTLPLIKVSEGTFPPGSEWARNPIPGCFFCDPLPACGGSNMMPNLTALSGTVPWGNGNLSYYGGEAWIDQTHCNVVCAGETKATSFPNNNNGTRYYGRTDGQMCEGKTQFPEPIPGQTSGFVMNHTYPDKSVSAFNIVDMVQVPVNLPPGKYLLSWRWDSEQSKQVWQSCADIEIVSPPPSSADNNHHTHQHLIIAVGVLAGVCCLLIIYIVYAACKKRNKSKVYDNDAYSINYAGLI